MHVCVGVYPSVHVSGHLFICICVSALHYVYVCVCFMVRKPEIFRLPQVFRCETLIVNGRQTGQYLVIQWSVRSGSEGAIGPQE